MTRAEADDATARLEAVVARVAPLPALEGAAEVRLEPMRTAGIAHDHYRILAGQGGAAPWVLRTPRFSLYDLPAADGLWYEAACFERLAPTGRAPGLVAILEPDDVLPRGGLVVRFVAGRKPAIPDDLPAIAETIAAVHALPVPAARPPLRAPADPVADLVRTIDRQAAYLEPAGVSEVARAVLAAEIEAARAEADRTLEAGPVGPIALTLADAHPGNFVISGTGLAMFLDAEKLLYGAPGADLAHATMYPSATWELGPESAPDPDAVVAFYRAYHAAIAERLGPETSRSIARLHPILRRLLWLRTTTFFARWRAELSDLPAVAAVLDPPLRRHIDGRIDDCFSLETIDAIRREWREDGPVLRALRDLAG